ncbi:glycoside hydrolase family 97 protein [Flavilitoribacter nigricans]|uniref:Alpha-glucosidase n=1 Tax=Flavilitoribacter nigricans (strain ATCC 23147 / DSM 23189 / NBRC 102662 / NCIMB 1420 / SS-2) TaxID=1122177 RepID=A0A2D0NAQ5_FLAN2|nr:glycoside hydrolase family 97 protein [Flavilitoribacter nigricans]PHN05249.1 alpha-glucosidase [Flavilitoribacter nigricans DSM 23189 = NBRC 102662]
MKNLTLLLLCIGTMVHWSCNDITSLVNIVSPNEKISVEFELDDTGAPVYLVRYEDEIVIDRSHLGLEFRDQPALMQGFEVAERSTDIVDESWEMPWGEQRTVRNHYQEMRVRLREKEAPARAMNLYFRAYDDGVAFRYELPEQEGVDTVIITDERSGFQLTGDHSCWWIPGDWDSYEHLYNTTKFSEIDALAKRNHPNLAQTYIPENAVNTPITMRTASGLHLSFHEANLTDYAGMTLKVDPEQLSLESELVGSSRHGYKVKRALPFFTPWRSIQISDDAAGLIESKLIVNLNEPNRLGDVSWIKPMKYVGIWWEMHLGKSSWDLASGKHGATTENAKAHIDFAAANNIGGVLVEGWNTGWEHWIGFEDREGVFDFVTPYPDYDLQEVVRYAREKGVEMIMHHETSAAPRTYDQQLDTAYALLEELGIHSVKSGYVGPIIPKGEHHHGQFMVQHFRRVLEKGTETQVAINAHEPIKPTGLRRTYPNAISREGLRGQEFNSSSVERGNPAEHLPIVAFTRMLAGPIDFTPGMFRIKLAPYKDSSQVNTTLAQQLALYVVIYSPIQMACDLIEHYEGQPAFQFIRDVGVDWDESRVLNGEVGDFVTIARKERETGNWFVGSITDEEARTVVIDFSFLEEGQQYKTTVYRDGADAHWDRNPTSIEIETIEVNAATVDTFQLAPGGGLAISLLRQ